MDIPWLQSFADRWRTQERQGRAPHALLLQGAAGTGKRATAIWLAQRLLQPAAATDLPQYPPPAMALPDLHWLTRPEDKHSIGVDQVRELIREMNLTSHDGLGKVAVVEPANIMTHAAANSLLKTLEEPSGNALIILIADRMSHLPATILSRCQRATLTIPDEEQALAWLDRLQPGTQWLQALAEAGGAPLAAIAAAERLDDTMALARDLKALGRRAASPIEVAERWTKQYPELALDWLGRQVQACIFRLNGGAPESVASIVDESVLQRMDSRNLFCYLDVINRLRGQASGSYNLQLTLEGLLIDWTEGLVHCRAQEGDSGLWPLAGAR
jgi:DNA polymerase III subunit delta'